MKTGHARRCRTGLELIQRPQRSLFSLIQKSQNQRKHNRDAGRKGSEEIAYGLPSVLPQMISDGIRREIVGEYGARPLYRMLGYFSLIGLLRVHVLLGDFTLALKVMENVELNQKVL